MVEPVTLPFPPLVEIQSDVPITWEDLEECVGDRLEEGVSICLLYSDGPEKRGGYFFHFQSVDQGYSFSTFQRSNVISFENGERCAEFINHVSGREYSEEMWSRSRAVNLRSDEETV